MNADAITYAEALQITLGHIHPLNNERVSLTHLCGRVLAEDLSSLVDSPSADVSLRDGYALRAADTLSASPEQPVTLHIVGKAVAGMAWEGEINPGQVARITTGAQLPHGVDTVVAFEATREQGDEVCFFTKTTPGENILSRGSDIAAGQSLFFAGKVLQPTNIGLIAAAGHNYISSVKRPRVAIIATGDEVVVPGMKLKKGQLFASNLIAISAWCTRYGMQTITSVVRDDAAELRMNLVKSLENHDVVITIGGTWKSERDLVIKMLEELNWQQGYRKVQMIPGKTAAFGVCRGKPVFCLPGGPPASNMAFLQLALPGLRKMAGFRSPQLPIIPARLTDTILGNPGYTTFISGRLEVQDSVILFHPLKIKSRLQAISLSEGITAVPGDAGQLPAGTIIQVQVWDWTEF